MTTQNKSEEQKHFYQRLVLLSSHKTLNQIKAHYKLLKGKSMNKTLNFYKIALTL